MKIAVIGGGSTYTPELINGFLERQSLLGLAELWLMDTSPERLEVVGGFAQRMVAAHGSPFKVILTGNQREAVAGASYVITQVRVGMMAARRADEYLGLRHGLIGQETTGIGGMAKALRTIPVILGVALDIRETAPHALLINFANPSGLVTEALNRYAPEVASVGLCNAPFHAKMGILDDLAKAMGRALAPEKAYLDTLGLNHLSWHRGFRLEGEDVWPQVIDSYVARLRKDAHPEWAPDLIETLRMIPNGYLQYYYDTAHKLEAQKAWPPSRAETVMQIEADLLRQYTEPGRSEPPADLMKRGGAYYSTVATQLIHAHRNNLGEIHVTNVRHNGAVPGWPVDWVLEMPTRVDAHGIHPLPAEPLPPVCTGLLTQVKMVEILTVEAAVHGDRRAAYEALLAHPLGPSAGEASAVLDDMLTTHQRYLPQF